MISPLKVLTLALATATSVTALRATQVVTIIVSITTTSRNLQGPANAINILSGPLFLIGQGPYPTIISGFTTIVTVAAGGVTAMQGAEPFTGEDDQRALVQALRDFVTVHQVLLNIIIGKAGIITYLPLIGPPVAAVLRTVEAVVDAIANGLIDLIPAKATDVSDLQVSLVGTIELAIGAYVPRRVMERSYPIDFAQLDAMSHNDVKRVEVGEVA